MSMRLRMKDWIVDSTSWLN